MPFKAVASSGEPLMAMYAEGSENTSVTRTRRNRGGSIERTDKYINIDNAPLPFKYSIGFSSGAQIDAKDAITLCQKAYFNIPIVRNIIDLMTEFSVGDIYFRNGSKTARDFFDAWWKKVGGISFQDRYYREYYRGSNVFVFRFDSTLKAEDIRKITSTFGLTTTSAALAQLEIPQMVVPVRYTILNPADILFSGGLSFYSGSYAKVLTDFELQRLRNPQTDEDREVLNALPADVRKRINEKNSIIYLPLDAKKVSCIFYKKQDYEPFACPMIFPILEDLNAKLELKRLDMAIARTQQQVILLVTTGAEPDKGGVNNANLIALQSLFQNESIGRVLVADYTTKAEFVIPDIADILNPIKYEELDKDINIGLNNILMGGEKFANQTTKIEVFLARLEHGRRIFLDEFLIPEVRRIAKSLGFKNFPTPYYDKISLKNSDLRDKIYLRLAELGLLTPEEAFIALDNGRLPDAEHSEPNQKVYKTNRSAGMYQPLIGGAKDAGETGRPSGSSAPQMTKSVGPIGTSKASVRFSLKKLTENMQAAKSLGDEVAKALKTKFKKRTLTKDQLAVATEITKIIVVNEEPNRWNEVIGAYVSAPIDKNPQRVTAVQELGSEFQCDDYLAGLLLISQHEQGADNEEPPIS